MELVVRFFALYRERAGALRTVNISIKGNAVPHNDRQVRFDTDLVGFGHVSPPSFDEKV